MITPDQNSVQIDMEDMWNAYLKCIRLLQEGKKLNLSKVAGISISSLCPGLVAMGENGEVLVDAIIYSDRRSTEEAEIILNAVGKDRLFEITANTAMAGAMSGTSMLWIKRHLPEAYEKTKYFGHLIPLWDSGCQENLQSIIPMRLTLTFLRPQEDLSGPRNFERRRELILKNFLHCMIPQMWLEV